jgi:hypothetical protein
MMVLETLLDIKLALLNFDTDKADLSLNRAGISLNRGQGTHNLSKASIMRWRRWCSLRRGGSCG